MEATPLSGHSLVWYGTDASGGNGATDAPTPDTQASGETTYYVSQVNDVTGCESDRATIVVSIKPQPDQPVIIAEEQSKGVFLLTSSSDTGNQWFFNDAMLSGETTNTLEVSDFGMYTVQVTRDGCVSERSEAFELLPLSLVDTDQEIKIWPNPSKDVVTIDFKTSTKRSVKLLNLNGKVMNAVSSDDFHIEMNVENLPSGVYLIKVQNATNAWTMKMIKM